MFFATRRLDCITPGRNAFRCAEHQQPTSRYPHHAARGILPDLLYALEIQRFQFSISIAAMFSPTDVMAQKFWACILLT